MDGDGEGPPPGEGEHVKTRVSTTAEGVVPGSLSQREGCLRATSRRLRSTLFLGCVAILAADATAQTASDMTRAREAVQEAFAARDAGDAPGFTEALETALRLRPGHPELHYLLASGYADMGDRDEAIRHLGVVEAMGLGFDPAGDSMFVQLWNDSEFQSLASRFADNRRPAGAARTHMRIPVEGDFVPEGLAYDPETGAFYLGSVRKRKILRAEPGQPPRELAPSGFQGLASAMGMVVDAERRVLWVCSTGLEQTAGITDEQRGRSSIFQFDLDSGALVLTYHFPPSDERVPARHEPD